MTVNANFKTCPICGMKYHVKAGECPKCNKPKGRLTKPVNGVVGLLAMIFVVTLLIVTSIDTKPKQVEIEKPKTPREKVFNSPWDGSVQQINDWFKYNLKDPDSLQVISWGEVTKPKDTEYKYSVHVHYRSKNGFGGYVIDRAFFLFDANGNIVEVASMTQ